MTQSSEITEHEIYKTSADTKARLTRPAILLRSATQPNLVSRSKKVSSSSNEKLNSTRNKPSFLPARTKENFPQPPHLRLSSRTKQKSPECKEGSTFRKLRNRAESSFQHKPSFGVGQYARIKSPSNTQEPDNVSKTLGVARPSSKNEVHGGNLGFSDSRKLSLDNRRFLLQSRAVHSSNNLRGPYTSPESTNQVV